MREKGKKRNFRLKNTSTKTKIMFQNSIKTKEERKFEAFYFVGRNTGAEKSRRKNRY